MVAISFKVFLKKDFISSRSLFCFCFLEGMSWSSADLGLLAAGGCCGSTESKGLWSSFFKRMATRARFPEMLKFSTSKHTISPTDKRGRPPPSTMHCLALKYSFTGPSWAVLDSNSSSVEEINPKPRSPNHFVISPRYGILVRV
jgi:hypothetical protein